MLPTVVAGVRLLTEVEAAPEPVLLAAGAATPPLRPRVQRLVVQQRVLVPGREVAPSMLASAHGLSSVFAHHLGP